MARVYWGQAHRNLPMEQSCLGSPVLNCSVIPAGPLSTKISPKAETLKVSVVAGGGLREDKGRLQIKPEQLPLLLLVVVGVSWTGASYGRCLDEITWFSV